MASVFYLAMSIIIIISVNAKLRKCPTPNTPNSMKWSQHVLQ